MTLNGSIDAVGNDNPTSRGFVYGPETSYGATTTEFGSFGNGSFTAGIVSLVCNTAYHFAAYATNGYLGYGSDQTFTTSACPVSAPSGGSGMIVGSGPLAPSATSFFNYTPPRFQIIQPNGTVSYPAATSTASTTPPVSYAFLRNRQLNDAGPDILLLQKFLNAHGFIIATSGPGSPGQESGFFGKKTYQALQNFQKANNLPATGYFGPLTRALINSQAR